MIRWFIRWRQRRKLASGLRQAAKTQLQNGEIDGRRFDAIIKTADNSKAMDRLLIQLEVNDDALGAINWDAIKEWIIANWPTILRLVMSLAILLLEPEEGEE